MHIASGSRADLVLRAITLYQRQEQVRHHMKLAGIRTESLKGNTVKRAELFQLSLVTSVAIRKYVKRVCTGNLLTSMKMFGDVFKWPLICEAFNRHFGNKQTCVSF